MISPTFYLPGNTTKKFSFTKLRHFPKKNFSVCLRYEPYKVQDGDDLYIIASKVFGKFGECYWTVIADLNGILKPDWLQVGQIIKVPVTVIEDKIDYKITYDNNVSTAIKI